MAIDFPNSPIDGTTYTYLGVTYTYIDVGGGSGYWGVVNASNIGGSATVGEIDAGTNDAKFISPLGLEGSKYGSLPQVNYHSKVGKVQLTTGQNNFKSLFRFDTSVTDGGAWESVGPTGGGADNTWDALDEIPAGAIVCVNAYLAVRSSVSGYAKVFAELAMGGITPDTGQDTLKLQLDTIDSVESRGIYIPMWIPTDLNKHFQVRYSTTNAAVDLINLRYTGFIEP